jgi:hypothetical protein
MTAVRSVNSRAFSQGVSVENQGGVVLMVAAVNPNDVSVLADDDTALTSSVVVSAARHSA